MRTVVVTPSAAVVSWEEADKHLRLDGDTDQQAEVEAMVAAATAHLDGPDGWLGRAIGAQTLEARFHAFDRNGLFLPYPPVMSLTSITYIDMAGVEQTLSTDQVELLGRHLVLAPGAWWPPTGNSREAVRVRYQAGYEQLPAPIRAAILLMVGDLYRFRETSGETNFSSVPMSVTVNNLLAPFRMWS